MKITSYTTSLATLLLLTLPISASAVTAENARQIISPFYDFLSNPQSESHAIKARQSFHTDWHSYYSNTGFKTLNETIESIQYFGDLIPDLRWEIKEINVSGNSVTVRGEATGTPSGDFFGVPHSGKSFRIMSIDVHTIEDGKVKQSYHIEDWAGAIKQLSAK